MNKIYIALILFVFLMQFSFLPFLFWGIVIPNLLLIVAIVITNQKSFWASVGYFLGIGILFEIFSSNLLGLNLIVFLIFGFLARFLWNFMMSKEKFFLVEILFWFLIKISWDIFLIGGTLFINFFQKEPSLIEWFYFLSGEYFLEIILFVLSGILIFRVIDFLKNQFNFQEK